jgi:N-acetylmuramoyl-L-alanine amidase
MSSKFFYVFGCGHGITTPGKRSHKGEDGEHIILEWDVVRLIALKLAYRLDGMGVDFTLMNASCEVDIKLGTRVGYVNWLHKEHGNVIYIPLHINAQGWGKKWREARGVRVHHYSKSTQQMAEVMVEAFEANTQFPQVDLYKAKFYKTVMSQHLFELRATKCPTILPEMGFMTNRHDAQYLATEGGMDDCCDALAGFVHRWESGQ